MFVPHITYPMAEAHVKSLSALASKVGLSPVALISLIMQFLNAGTKLIPVLTDVLTAFQGGFDWSKLGPLLLTDGPLVIAVAQAIATLLGQTLPVAPTPAA